jgi:transcription initiation factor IIE alpha subunit
MSMKEIFEKDPERLIARVVMVDQYEQQVIGTEVEEYVVTKQIQRILQDIVDQFLESRAGRETDVCAWISGFFGSGKSHLAKILGHLLSNSEVEFSDGTKVNVADYFARKHGLKGTGIISTTLKTKSFFYNMLKFDRAKDEDLSRYILRSLLKDLGYSDILWVAEIEDNLKDRGLWEDFKKAIRADTNKEWEEIRKTEVLIRPAIVRALVTIDPATYPNLSITQQAVEDQRNELILGTDRLVKRLLEEAERLDKVEGRIILILDEVGLYLRSVGANGLTELNSLAEDLEKIGKGKIWLFATAQEALESVAPEIGGRQEQIGWLQDRFPLKYSLAPENIPAVVNQRLLEKNKNSAEFSELKRLFDESGGQLALSVGIQGATHDEGLFADLNFASFSESYPLLPYDISMMIDIFASLRAKGRKLGQETKLAGRERATLGVVQSILKDQINKSANVGDLATFDLIYGAIDSVLKIVSSDENSIIAERIDDLKEVNGFKVSSVAKALFLLQQIEEWIPCTAHNIAAVLYPKIGVSPADHQATVQKCLDSLASHKWIKLEEGNYRFLSQIERNFEEDVNDALQTVVRELKERVVEVAFDSLKDLKKYNHRKLRVFEVTLSIDEDEPKKRSDLNLKVYSPFWVSDRDEPLQDAYYKSLGESDRIFWVSKNNSMFVDKVKRLLAVEKVFSEWSKRAKTPQELAELEPYRSEILNLKEELPQLLDTSLREGTIFFYGKREDLKGKATVEEVFQRWLSELTTNLFPNFEDAAVGFPKDEDIAAILKWRGGHLPSIYTSLKLVDADQRNILTSGPVAHSILSEIIKRGEVSGKDIAAHFGGKSYGWDERVVRTVMAALRKNGNIQADPDNESTLIYGKNFSNAIFSVGVAATIDERSDARKFISESFWVDAGITSEEIAQSIETEVNKKLCAIQSLVSTDGYYRLPYVEEMNQLSECLKKFLDQRSPSHRVKMILEKVTQSTLKQGLSLLSDLEDFVKGIKFSQYLTMRRFAGNPLESLLTFDPSVSKESASFKEKLYGKSLIADWKSLYDNFLNLESKYEMEYLKAHKECQDAVDYAFNALLAWAEEKQIPKSKVESSAQSISNLKCKSAEAKYSENDFLCSVCNRTLSTVKNHESLVESRIDDVKERLFVVVKKPAEPVYNDRLVSSQTVTSLKELERAMAEVSDFAKYWIRQGKKVELKVEGELPSE